jgi:hypothetical protein
MNLIRTFNITNNLTVNFFTVKKSNNININNLYNLLGFNIPKYNHLFNEDEYLLCISSYVDIRSICKNNNYEIKTIQTKVINKHKYNNNYTPYQTVYNKNIVFDLEKLNLIYENI